MDKQSFSKLVDESLHTLRRKLLDAFPEEENGQSLCGSARGSPKTFELRGEKGEKSSKSSSQRIGSQSPEASQVVPTTSDASPVMLDVEMPETPVHSNPDLVPAFKGSEEEARAIRGRLRLRLGALNDSLVSGKALFDACVSLGLTRFTIEDMNLFVNLLANYIELEFEREEGQEKPKRHSVNSANMFFFKNHQDVNITGKPVWRWPNVQSASRTSIARSASMQMQSYNLTEPTLERKFNVVPAAPLMEVFLAKESETHRKIFGQRHMKQFQAMKEILLAGDTNRLVAELTFVRINDLAAPPDEKSWGLLLEPLVALIIISNGVMVGFQSDEEHSTWPGLDYLEVGREESGDVFATSLLRFCRLIRLVRIVKVFRLKIMKDLRLMVKGLVAGIKTLIMAFILLFTVLYVIAGFATMTIGNSQEVYDADLKPFFRTIPDSMFTCFRCFTGECVNQAGAPIHAILADKIGFGFVFGYVASFMLVSLGIFNVILAVYVDITMKAAKENDLTVEQHSRESIRIARIARELLKKFAAAFRLFQDMDEGVERGKGLKIAHSHNFMDGDMLESIAITKELFLMVIQDRRVQGLMDELELPPDRANLFEIIDADGSGTLQLSELVHGLLKIRGEISKSDVVAGLLATKSVQEKVEEVLHDTSTKMDELRFELQGLQMAVQRKAEGHEVVSVDGSGGTVDMEPTEPAELREEPPALPFCSRPSFSIQIPSRPAFLMDESEVAPPSEASEASEACEAR
ncbi:unnamed protein product [Durusdinium trenchii]|uniref:Ion transport domain-containing protein n=1 Tax=Durusdinium trenchii TaxID=1381693 RepID=A0ABP0KV14_9DINO